MKILVWKIIPQVDNTQQLPSPNISKGGFCSTLLVIMIITSNPYDMSWIICELIRFKKNLIGIILSRIFDFVQILKKNSNKKLIQVKPVQKQNIEKTIFG